MSSISLISSHLWHVSRLVLLLNLSLSLSTLLNQCTLCLSFSGVVIAGTKDKSDLFSVIIPLAPLDLESGPNHLQTHIQAHLNNNPHATRG